MTPALAVLPRWDIGQSSRLRASIMLLMRIDRWDVLRDGPLTDERLSAKIEALGYALVSRTYPAGATFSAHADARARIQAVARGTIKITIDGESAILTAGDIAFVPGDAVRRLEVIGRTAARCLEAVDADGASSL